MSFKAIVFSLFLYVCLVWVGAFYLRSGPEIQDFGLLWTAVGLAAVLAFIIFAKIFSWWRMRARKVPVPAAPRKPAEPLHEDDAAILALIARANSALAKIPAHDGIEKKSSLFTFPVFLLIGPEASGKTSTFLHSGVEPELLAGQESASLPQSSTRLCNFWLARNAIFVEFSGKTFSADLERWRKLLKLLKGEPPLPVWKRLWSQPSRGIALRGIIAFADVKELMGGSADPQRLERSCREWEKRLRTIAEVFNVPVPVYQVFSKCDGIPFFTEFFRRLPETESNQILGCTLPISLNDTTKTEVLAETEAKGLTNSFRLLYQALAKRRLQFLFREPERGLRPAIYEFPRELKRIRSALVQFLTEVFRPNALRFGPVLRGYYFCARSDREAGGSYLHGRLDASLNDLDASQVFRGDATRLFKQEDVAGKGSSSLGRKLDAFRWMFVSDLFHEVILRDALPQRSPRGDPNTERTRKAVFASACTLCCVLSLIFIHSWWRNRELLQRVETAATAPISRRGANPSLANLESLEALRKEVQGLRNGSGLSMHWGLYSGNRILEAARRAYFREFQNLILDRTNARMVQSLAQAPTSGTGGDQSAPVHDILKAHLMISSGRCKAEPQFLSSVLKNETGSKDDSEVGAEWRSLANRQIDFYTSELQLGNPCHIAEDRAACDRARQYLRQTGGVESVYRVILEEVEKSVAKPGSLQDAAPNYAQVLSGPTSISPAFSPEGWKAIEKASKNRGVSTLELCISDGVSSPSDPRAIQQMFIRDYIDRWRKYIAGFSVVRYNGAKDAARKLEILSDRGSPLLALFATVANQTSFPITPESSAFENVPILGGLVKKGEKAANKVQDFRRDSSANLSTADISRAFQPASWVVPPGSDTWVVEKNDAYMDALAQLGHSMQEIADGRGSDPATTPAAKQNLEKAFDAVRQIAKGFKTLQVEGTDADVQRLLREPIQNAQSFIPPDQRVEIISKVNGKARDLCRNTLKDTLQKFPFQNSSARDTSLSEFASAFAPGTGSIWKFVQESLPDLVVKEGATWKAKDPSKSPQPTADMLTFLSKAQAITDAFFSGNATQPQFAYILRRRADSTAKDSVLETEIDGQSHRWDTSLQAQFTWPALPGKNQGGVGRILTGEQVFPFASRSGPWGIFKMIDDAEPRPLLGKLLEWKSARGSNGNPELIKPPVRLDIVEFPGGVDVFNRKFFEGVKCAVTAVQAFR